MLASLYGLVFVISSHAALHENRIPVQDTVKYPVRSKTLRDTTGTLVTVNRIFIIGNRLTRDRIVLRELSLKPGDVVRTTDLPALIDLDKKKLINTRLFNTVDIKSLPFEDNTIDLLVDLNERWYTFPSPIFELSDRNFNEWWQNYNHDFRRVNYGMRLYQYNMRGRNETLRLTGQFGYQRKFEFSYRMPYIDRKQKQGLIFDADFQETKNLAYRTVAHKLEYIEADRILKTTRGAAVTYLYRNSFYQNHALRVEWRRNIIDDTVQQENPNYFRHSLRQQYTMISYSFGSDHRDYFAYPLTGSYLLFTAYKYGIWRRDDVEKFETTVSYSKFIPLKNNYYLSNNTVALWSTPDHLPYANYSAMGYRKQFVKGYEVYIIEGPWYFLNKTTFKKLLFSHTYHWGIMPLDQFRHVPLRIYLKTYADVGYVRNYPDYKINSLFTNKLISGVGGGLDFVASYDLVIRLEYTFNAQGSRGFFFHVKKEF